DNLIIISEHNQRNHISESRKGLNQTIRKDKVIFPHSHLRLSL
ncbi:unnamed protein product, partial [Arabidopsis halleri]